MIQEEAVWIKKLEDAKKETEHALKENSELTVQNHSLENKLDTKSL